MPCNTLVEPACKLAGSITRSVSSGLAGDMLSGIANSVDAGIRWIVENTATWWIRMPSPNLAAEPAVTHIQRWLLPITAAVAVGGVIAAGARMALTRRANPLLDVSGGLLTLAAATALGALVPALLLKAGDAWSTWVLQASTGGHFVQRLILALDLGGNAAPAVVIVFGILAIIVSLVQAVLMLFRQMALIILAGVLPLAAAGSIAPMTRPWVRKVTAWMLALICYKPAAAAVYATAFTMIGAGGSPRTAVMGFVMLAMSLVMLPALMKFFTWTTGAIGSPGGGGGQFLGAAAMGAYAIGAMRAGSGAAGPAQDQAAYLSSRLGPPPASPGGAGSGGPLPPGGGPGGPAAPAGPGGTTAGGSPGGGPAGPSAPAGSGGTTGGSPGGGPAGGVPMGYPGSPSGAGPASGMRPPAGAGPLPTGAGPAPAGSTGVPAGLADVPAGSVAGSAGAAGGAASGAAAAAGPAAAGAAAAAKVTTQTTRLAAGAMEEGEEQ